MRHEKRNFSKKDFSLQAHCKDVKCEFSPYALPNKYFLVRTSSLVNDYYLLTGCKGRTRKYKPKVFHTARASDGCLENQGLVFPGMARAPS